MPAKKKLHETFSSTLNDLSKLIRELEENKKTVQQLIQKYPEDLKNHRVFCSYIGKIQEILRLKIQEKKIDPFRLLSEALQTVAVFLAENNEVSAAYFIGDNAEEIEEKVIQQWWNYQEIETKDQKGRQVKELKKASIPLEKGALNKKKNIKKRH